MDPNTTDDVVDTNQIILDSDPAAEVLDDQAEIAAPEETQAETTDSAPDDAAIADEPASETPKPAHSGVQKRINDLTRQLRDRERTIQELRSAPAAVRPNMEDYDTAEAHQEALMAYMLDNRLAAREQAQYDNTRAVRSDLQAQQYNESLAAVRSVYKDYDTVVPPSTQLTPTIAEALLDMADVAPKLLYFIQKHGGLDQFEDLSPLMQVRELTRMEARMIAQEGTPKTKVVSSAPQPIEKVAAGRTKGFDYETASIAQIAAYERKLRDR